MIRNVKPLLAMPLFCLAPLVAGAAGADGSPLPSDYVALRPSETVQLPSRPVDGAKAFLAYVTQDYLLMNWTGLNAYVWNGLTGGGVLPNPLAPTAVNTWSGNAVTAVPVGTYLQSFGYTTNPADMGGAAKTCLWDVQVTQTGGVCTGTITTYALGTQGVQCLLWNGSAVDPNTCQAVVGVGLQ
ncbi:hypothetical protein LY474_30395 [Myxococcus stipitatus]|uniref:hypothetical protein n=1 Tax=Myxococcus stipitatus TaxID=83455 RepID=UPI001F28EFA3|nr:hypothetical protein [Myxococcus stipitatus]MCE9672125.1 hypothetical protein [Myxococcus stipitatus]